jgi:hypothetical protein
MALALRNTSRGISGERTLAPGLILMLATGAIALLIAVLNSDLVDSFPFLYLLPWIIGLAVVFLVPSAYLYYKGRFHFYDPLVFATWMYFFPMFVIGGLTLTAGWSQPYFLSFIQDAEYNLPYTVVLVALGFAGLAVGYLAPFGSKVGAAISSYLPTRDFDTSAMLIPGLFLMFVGALNTAAALFLGVIGYQKSEVVDSYTGIIFLTTLFWMQGSFILWYLIFRNGKFNVRSAVLVVLLLGTTFGRALFAGNRAALLQVFLIVVLAFLLAGGRFNFRRSVLAGVVLSVSLIVGMIYGTTFRNVKGTESRVSMDQYTENIFQTFDQVGRVDLSGSLEFALMGLAERMETLSSVAVVVSNYEQLQPYEESYGLDNNIWKDISTFFIPRLLWSEKPFASEPRRYSDLYFNYGENSFAITPMGDLLRNYGPIGVPVGMFLFGIMIRFIYRALVENQPRTIWRATMYFMLVITISYEGFYGTLIPMLFKIAFTAVVGLLIVGLVARSMGHQRKAEPA